MKKRFVSILLAAIILLTILPISAIAEKTAYHITNGSPEADKDKNGGYIYPLMQVPQKGTRLK